MSSEAATGFFGAQCVCRACKPTWPSHPPGPRTLYTVSVAPEGLELRSRSLWSVPRCLLVAPVSTGGRLGLCPPPPVRLVPFDWGAAPQLSPREARKGTRLEPFQINIPCFSSSSRTSAAQRREIRVASAPRAAKACYFGSPSRAKNAGAAHNNAAALVAEIGSSRRRR